MSTEHSLEGEQTLRDVLERRQVLALTTTTTTTTAAAAAALVATARAHTTWRD